MKGPPRSGRAAQGYDSRKKDLFAPDFVENARNTCPVFLRFSPRPAQKSLFMRCEAVLREGFFVQTIWKAPGILCISGVFRAVWAEKSLAKPIVSLSCTPFAAEGRSLNRSIRTASTQARYKRRDRPAAGRRSAPPGPAGPWPAWRHGAYPPRTPFSARRRRDDRR